MLETGVCELAHIFLHFIFADKRHIVSLTPLSFSFVTHPYALPLVPEYKYWVENHVNSL